MKKKSWKFSAVINEAFRNQQRNYFSFWDSVFWPKKLISGQEDMKIKRNSLSTLVLYRILLSIPIQLLRIENF
jgi:hypothetical protein